MYKILAALAAIIVSILLVNPASALSFGISPSSVTMDVPASSYSEAIFTVSDFEGEVIISLEGIPLEFEPVTADVSELDNEITVRMYGDTTLGNQIFEGKICFLALEGNTGAGLKVTAVIHHGADNSNQVEVTTTVLRPSSGVWIGGGSFPSSTTIEDVVQEETPAVVEEDIPEEEGIVLPDDEDVWDDTPAPPVVPPVLSTGESSRFPWILVVAGVAVLAVIWYMRKKGREKA